MVQGQTAQKIFAFDEGDVWRHPGHCFIILSQFAEVAREHRVRGKEGGRGEARRAEKDAREHGEAGGGRGGVRAVQVS